jgi:hypothetical protein
LWRNRAMRIYVKVNLATDEHRWFFCDHLCESVAEYSENYRNEK